MCVLPVPVLIPIAPYPKIALVQIPRCSVEWRTAMRIRTRLALPYSRNYQNVMIMGMSSTASYMETRLCSHWCLGHFDKTWGEHRAAMSPRRTRACMPKRKAIASPTPTYKKVYRTAPKGLPGRHSGQIVVPTPGWGVVRRSGVMWPRSCYFSVAWGLVVYLPYPGANLFVRLTEEGGARSPKCRDGVSAQPDPAAGPPGSSGVHRGQAPAVRGCRWLTLTPRAPTPKTLNWYPYQ
jgi:hypothetical protein